MILIAAAVPGPHKLQAHSDDPQIRAGLGNHQQTHLGLRFAEQRNGQIAAEGDQDGRYHFRHVIPAGVPGNGVQDHDADAGDGENAVPEDGQLQIALVRAPVVLGQQAHGDPDDGGGPDHHLHRRRSGEAREGEFPDEQQDHIKRRHRDGGDLQAGAHQMLDLGGASTERPEDPGNEVEGIAAAEGQGQDAVENKQGAALRHGEKYDACYEVEQQIYRIKYGLHNIGHLGLIGFVIHVFILSV